jgi:hypothetical protein
MVHFGKCPTCAGVVRMSTADVRLERIVICENGHPVQLRHMTKPMVPGSPRPQHKPVE